ncbi:MAG: hypothetical protein ACLTDR_08455 [Adlercreutzia equolifaciens]
MTTYALVGASEFNSEQFSARNGAGAFDAVIAVDGGFASLAAVGCAPDLAIGDFDSAGMCPRGGSVAFPPAEGRLRHGAGLGKSSPAAPMPWRSTGLWPSIMTLANLQLSPLSPSVA